MQDVVIDAQNLSVVKGAVHALDGVSCEIRTGAITGLIGPSGSGKTTLMRAIIGAQIITSGSLTVLGMPTGHKALRKRIGYVSQSLSVYEDLTVWQNLWYFAAILGQPKESIAKAIQLVDLQPQTDRLVSTLSGGQRARVSLGVALLGEADLLILDEPTVGLDPVLRKHLWALFADLAARGKTLLISSHVMDEAERCSDILLLRDGKLLSQGSRKDLLQKTDTNRVEDAFLRLVEGKNNRAS